MWEVWQDIPILPTPAMWGQCETRDSYQVKRTESIVSRQWTYFTPVPVREDLTFVLPPSQSPLRRAQGQGGPGPHPLVDVLVDRVCALVESALEEKGAHCDG